MVGQFLLIALVALLGLRRGSDTRVPHGVRRVLATIGGTSILVGVVTGVRGALELGRNLTPLPHPPPRAELVRTGMYGRVRHPIYAAVMLAAFGWAIAMASPRALAAAGFLAVWLDAKARREEAWLIARFSDYAAYRTQTRRFLPGVY